MTRRHLWGCSLGSFTDDSDSDSEHGVPKQCYKVLGGSPTAPLGWGEDSLPQIWL